MGNLIGYLLQKLQYVVNSACKMTTVTPTAIDIQAGQVLISGSVEYLVRQFTGEGSFGRVAKCENIFTGEKVAIKILKQSPYMKEESKRELHMLDVIRHLDPDHANVVKFYEMFEYMGNTCMVFEVLDKCLFTMMEERHFEPLSLAKIRPIAKQLLVALDALSQRGVLHTDIKLDNVMLVNELEQPLRVKLIDFGLALTTSEVTRGMTIQPVGFRAPEVYLGLPITEAVDVFGLGCLLSSLYVGEYLFPTSCEFHSMKGMVKVLGMPEFELLSDGVHFREYFMEETDGHTKCRLLTAEEYTAATGTDTIKESSLSDILYSLDELDRFHPPRGEAELTDRLEFVDFLKNLLRFDANKRTTAGMALDHPFITMSHLTIDPDHRDYWNKSRKVMNDCQKSGNADLDCFGDEEQDMSSARLVPRLVPTDDDSDWPGVHLTHSSREDRCSPGQILSFSIAEEDAEDAEQFPVASEEAAGGFSANVTSTDCGQGGPASGSSEVEQSRFPLGGEPSAFSSHEQTPQGSRSSGTDFSDPIETNSASPPTKRKVPNWIRQSCTVVYASFNVLRLCTENAKASKVTESGEKGPRKFCRRVASTFFCCLKCPKTVD